jgi:hypothetical protein
MRTGENPGIVLGMKVQSGDWTGTVVGLKIAPKGYRIRFGADAARNGADVFVDWGKNILGDQLAKRGRPIKYAYAYSMETALRLVVVAESYETPSCKTGSRALPRTL